MPKKYTYKHRYRNTYKGVHLDIRANTNAELIEKVEKRKRQIDGEVPFRHIYLKDFGEQFLESKKLNSVSAGWYRDLCYTFNSKILGYLGDRIMEEITPMEIQSMLNAMAGMSESYVKKVYDLTCQIWKYAYRLGVVTQDMTILIDKPSGETTNIGRSLTDYEREVFLKVIDGHRGELFCKLMLYCGMRPSEIRALTWGDIDLDNMTITVGKSMQRNKALRVPKTDAGFRRIPIPTHLKTLLISKQAAPRTNLVPQSDMWRRRMWDNVKRLMDIEMGATLYRNKIVEHKLPEPFKMYYLRHTYCTDLEKKGVPINIASRLMGHSDIKITAKIYTHASVEALDIARNLIG